MTTSETCRHGLLTYERDGETYHRYDGSRCENEPERTRPRGPELLAYERQSLKVAEAPPTPPPPVVTPRQPDGPRNGFEPAVVEPTAAAPAKRRGRFRVVAGAALTAVLLLGAGVAVGFAARNRTVDRQQRRVTTAEREITALHGRVTSKQATIDDQQRAIATAREQRDQLKRQNAQLSREAAQSASPTGANATSFADGMYEVGSAIQGGQYRTDGSDTCYWAKLSTGDTNSIIENNLGAGPQTVTIDSPFFESEGCGSWTKVA